MADHWLGPQIWESSSTSCDLVGFRKIMETFPFWPSQSKRRTAKSKEILEAWSKRELIYGDLLLKILRFPCHQDP
ncbi:unnamed protein product [Cochlearia groenlandica]